MEGGKDLTPEQLEHYFDHDLNSSPKDVQEKYHHLLLDERLKCAEKNGGKPAGPIPLDVREMLLRAAKVPGDTHDSEKALKMERDWNTYTSKDGRPPIGGAQDN